MPGLARAQQKRGGTFRYAKGHGQTTDTLDPATHDNGFMTATAYGYSGFLTGVAPDASVEPQLAERWEATPDAKVWRFKLRSGATFHRSRA